MHDGVVGIGTVLRPSAAVVTSTDRTTYTYEGIYARAGGLKRIIERFVRFLFQVHTLILFKSLLVGVSQLIQGYNNDEHIFENMSFSP